MACTLERQRKVYVLSPTSTKRQGEEESSGPFKHLAAIDKIEKVSSLETKAEMVPLVKSKRVCVRN